MLEKSGKLEQLSAPLTVNVVNGIVTATVQIQRQGVAFLKIEYYGRLFYAFIYIFSILYACDNLFKNKNTNLIIFLLIAIFGYTYEKFSGLQEILIFLLIYTSHN